MMNAGKLEMTLGDVRDAVGGGGGGEMLGSLAWWTLPDAEVERRDLLTLWAGEGLDSKLLPEEVGPEKAFGIATREAQGGLKDRLVRLSLRNESRLVTVVLREHKDHEGNVQTRQEAKVELDRKRRALESADWGYDVVATITKRYAELRDRHTADDVRASVVKAIHSFASIPLRPTGGVYFIPQASWEGAQRLERAVARVGAGARLFLVPVARTAQADAALSVAAQGAFEAELAALAAEIEKFEREPPSRESTLERRLATYEDVRRRANLYRAILSVQLGDLDGRLDAMAKGVDAILSGGLAPVSSAGGPVGVPALTAPVGWGAAGGPCEPPQPVPAPPVSLTPRFEDGDGQYSLADIL